MNEETLDHKSFLPVDVNIFIVIFLETWKKSKMYL